MLAALVILALAPAAGTQPDAAAERKALDDAFGFIREKKYLFAVARIAPLVKSTTLPAPVVKAVRELINDVRNLEGVTRLSAAPVEQPLPEVAVELLPVSVKRPYTWLELLNAAGRLLDMPTSAGTTIPWKAEEATKLLEVIAGEFGPEAAAKLRVELSAKLFLGGSPQEASKLIENESPNDYAREVLADLRTIIVGGGELNNPQVARFIPEKGLTDLPGAAALVPAALRSKWVRPKPPLEIDTTLSKLELQTRKAVVTAAKRELEALAKKIATAAETIQEQLPKK